MIHKKEQMPVQIRPQMRGGKGQAQLTTLFAPEEITSSVRMCAQIRLQPGCSIGLHEHATEDEIYYLLQGTGVVMEDGKSYPVQAGDAVLTGNGESHAIENTGDEDLVLFAVVVTY